MSSEAKRVLGVTAALALVLRGDRPLRRAVPDQRARARWRRPDVGRLAAVPGDRGRPRSRAIPTAPGSPTTRWTPTPGIGATTRRSCVPANTLVHVTIYQYDTATGLRNPFISQPSGTVGSDADQRQAHPGGRSDDAGPHVRDPADRPVGPAPGRLQQRQEPLRQRALLAERGARTRSRSRSAPRRRASTAGSASCRAAAGFIQGNGGPMQTVGYMGGFIKVV